MHILLYCIVTDIAWCCSAVQFVSLHCIVMFILTKINVTTRTQLRLRSHSLGSIGRHILKELSNACHVRTASIWTTTMGQWNVSRRLVISRTLVLSAFKKQENHIMSCMLCSPNLESHIIQDQGNCLACRWVLVCR